MTVRPRVFGLTLVALLFVAPKSHASTILIANLTNSQEPGNIVPTLSPVNGGGLRPVSFGTATFVLNDAMTAMTFTAEIFNIDVTGTQTPDTFDNLTAAHIHAGPNIAPATNGVVWGFFGAPFNDNNPNDFSFTPFGPGLVGGTFSGKWDLTEGNGTTNGVPNNLTNQLPFILSSQAYINFHTVQFGGGEIRGVLVTPEPGTWLLVGGGLALMLRRRFTRR
jgi:hypothetical protein